MTRDRKELDAEWSGREFTVVDTGGWLATEDSLGGTGQRPRPSVRSAEADVVLLVVDATVGVTDEDLAVAKMVQRSGRPVRVVANKVDSTQREHESWEAVSLGLGDPWPVSALHGRGTGDLLDEVVALLPDADGAVAGEGSEVAPARICGWGTRCPGWRWSAAPTWASRPCSTAWSATTARSSTTCRAPRGTASTPWSRRPTARSASSTPPVCAASRGPSEEPSTSRCCGPCEALDRADIALLVIDATAGVTHQDQRLAERIGAAGCPTVVVLNKWELLDDRRPDRGARRRGRPAGLPRRWRRCSR